MFWIALSLTAILIVGGDFLLQLFGEEFKEGYWVLMILSLGQLVNAATGSAAVFMNMSGMESTLKNIFLSSTIFLLISLLLVNNKLNISSVSLIVFFTNSMISVITTYIVYSKTKISTFYIPIKNVKKNYNKI